MKKETFRNLIVEVLALIFISSLAFAQNLPKIKPPAGFEELEGTESDPLSVEQMQQNSLWVRNATKALNDLKVLSQSGSPAERHEILLNGFQKQVLASAPKESEILLRYILGRAVKIDEFIKQESTQGLSSVLRDRLSLLLGSLDLAIHWSKTDIQKLQGEGKTPYAKFGIEYSLFLNALNSSVTDASARYKISELILGFLLWDLYRDAQKESYKEPIHEINNFLISIPRSSTTDIEYVNRTRLILALYENTLQDLPDDIKPHILTPRGQAEEIVKYERELAEQKKRLDQAVATQKKPQKAPQPNNKTPLFSENYTTYTGTGGIVQDGEFSVLLEARFRGIPYQDYWTRGYDEYGQQVAFMLVNGRVAINGLKDGISPGVSIAEIEGTVVGQEHFSNRNRDGYKAKVGWKALSAKYNHDIYLGEEHVLTLTGASIQTTVPIFGGDQDGVLFKLAAEAVGFQWAQINANRYGIQNDFGQKGIVPAYPATESGKMDANFYLGSIGGGFDIRKKIGSSFLIRFVPVDGTFRVGQRFSSAEFLSQLSVMIAKKVELYAQYNVATMKRTIPTLRRCPQATTWVTGEPYCGKDNRSHDIPSITLPEGSYKTNRSILTFGIRHNFRTPFATTKLYP